MSCTLLACHVGLWSAELQAHHRAATMHPGHCTLQQEQICFFVGCARTCFQPSSSSSARWVASTTTSCRHTSIQSTVSRGACTVHSTASCRAGSSSSIHWQSCQTPSRPCCKAGSMGSACSAHQAVASSATSCGAGSRNLVGEGEHMAAPEATPGRSDCLQAQLEADLSNCICISAGQAVQALHGAPVKHVAPPLFAWGRQCGVDEGKGALWPSNGSRMIPCHASRSQDMTVGPMKRAMCKAGIMLGMKSSPEQTSRSLP